MRKKKFVLRTIKSGQVKIYGRIFTPTSKWLEYDGRLDGQRWAFGLYWRGDEQLPFVELWGTEEAYIAARTEEGWDRYCEEESKSIAVVFDEKDRIWYYPWATWCTEEQEGEPWRRT